jgi:3-deoxy-D-manno-octulosonate 8-phosphate phosphatase KdsC-like HAD superfamily phosphatase
MRALRLSGRSRQRRAEVKAAAKLVTQRAGGQGAVREAIEHVLRRDAAGRKF